MKASVLMSIFNEPEDIIMESVDSILAQTFSDFELIIVHDNPCSKTKDNIIKQLLYKDSRIKVIENQKNIGLAMSMNKAFEVSSGEIIIRMDADDISEPHRFQREIELLSTGNWDLIFTNYTYIDGSGNELYNGRVAINNKSVGSELISDIIFEGIIHHPTVAMTRDIFIESGGYRDFPCSQDLDLWLRILENKGRLLFLNESLLKYRIRTSSITGSNRVKQHVTITYIIKLFEQRLFNGYDTFSIAEYNTYISSRVGEKESARFAKALSYLKCAQCASSPWNKYFNRILAFCISSVLRHSYIVKRKNSARYIRRLELMGCGNINVL